MARCPARVLVLPVIVANATIAALLSQDAPQIRSGITAVPIDVRVFDRHGRPVTNLRESDFNVFEDGVPQNLTHFAVQDFRTSGRAGDRTTANGDPSSGPQRTFLIVLGRGRLEAVSKGVSGLAQFLESGLHETDRAAILVYKRVTEFSHAREPLIRLLKRYGEGHNLVEARLDHFFISPNVTDDIDSLLRGPGLPELRELPHPYPPTNVGQLYLALDHLRNIDGEKHIIFVSEDGVNFGQRITATLAQLASDARVTISPIQTGGTPSRIMQPSARARSTMVRQKARSMSQAFAYADLRKIARDTGGVSSAYEYAESTLTRLSDVTSFQYLLGYQPANTKWDGKHRQIEVKVKRSGVSVLHRRSYYAGPELLPEDRARMIVDSRIGGAGQHPDLIKEIGVNIAAQPASASSDGKSSLDVQISVNVADLRFEKTAGLFVATLHVAAFCGNADQDVIGELWQKFELKLSETSHNELTRDGFRSTLQVPVSGHPAYIKVVVYEPQSDRLGTAVLTLK